MSIPGLNDMRQLLDAAIREVEIWQESPTVPDIPPHRVANVRDQLRAIRGCGSVGRLRTGTAHVTGSISALGVLVSELAPSLLRLQSHLDERKRK
jgi:hypothetical protein